MRSLAALVLLASLATACRGTIDEPGADEDAAIVDDGGTTPAGDPDAAPDAAADAPEPKTKGREIFATEVQPALAEKCGSCHLGERFGIATLVRAGATFTEAETDRNLRAFRTTISLDAPEHSRLLAKIVPRSSPKAMDHGGPALDSDGDPLLATLRKWIAQEKLDRCADCGLSAKTQWLAYVKQPAVFWGIPRFPVRADWGLRTGAKIMMQPIDPATFTAKGAPVEFLPPEFCPKNECDFGHLQASHDGKRLAFECKKSVAGEPLFEQSWNLCIAEIGEDGRAKNPRFLLPKPHAGFTVARSTPMGLYDAKGRPLRGAYDVNFQIRRRHDQHPAWSPDDSRVYFASMRPDPRTGGEGTQTYHGFEHLDNVVAARVGTGTEPAFDLRTIYMNEGGVANFPFFLKNGNVAFHTWNLERIDRHMYLQSTADGMGELPVLFGRTQGPNMWGKATELANGGLIGMTGIRRGALENFVPFFADHTLGAGEHLNPGLASFVVLDEDLKKEIGEFGYCAGKEGPNCKLSRFFEDVAYSPDGRAFVAHDPNPVYTKQGEEFYRDYGTGSTTAERLASLGPYLPKSLGISLVDHRGKVQRFLDPESGYSYRYPAWVGPRQRPVVQPWVTNESVGWAELHVADVPVWLTFRDTDTGPDKSVKAKPLDSIVAVRVLVKEIAGNDCLNDGFGYRQLVNNGAHDHPTHLGITNSTGYVQLVAPGTPFGDIPLPADKSMRVRLPAGKLILFQGIDAKGLVVRQRARISAFAPGQKVDSGVKRSQYVAQCGACHGKIDERPFVPLEDLAKLPAGPLDYATEAKLVDLTTAPRRTLTFLGALRKVIDTKCVSCHSGSKPAAELSLEAQYSPTANYPAGKWASAALSDGAYLSSVPADRRVPGYNWSVSWKWALAKSDAEYQTSPQYKSLVDSYAPVAGLTAWDPAFQNLHAKASDGSFVYLGTVELTAFGRSDNPGGNARTSFLLEVLTGEDHDPRRAFTGTSHKGFVTQDELRLFAAVLDVGFPFMARCDDRVVPSGPNAGKPWGDPKLADMK